MKIFFLLFFIMGSAEARSLLESGGSSVGSGGYSVVCWNQQGIGVAEALDLYEGRLENNYNYSDYPGMNSLQIARIFANKIDASMKLDPNSQYAVSRKLEYVAAHMHFLPPDSPLKQSYDTRFELKNSNCKLVQTINFNSSIDFSAALWTKHNVLNQAALMVHEALYWHLRELGSEVDSRRVRKVVSYLFAGGELSPISPNIPKSISRTQECYAKPKGSNILSTSFVSYVNENGVLTLRFKRISGFKLVAESKLNSDQIFSFNSFAIDKTLAKKEVVQGELESVSESNSKLQLEWGQGKIRLTGLILGDFPVDEEVNCTNWDFKAGAGLSEQVD